MQLLKARPHLEKSSLEVEVGGFEKAETSRFLGMYRQTLGKEGFGATWSPWMNQFGQAMEALKTAGHLEESLPEAPVRLPHSRL